VRPAPPRDLRRPRSADLHSEKNRSALLALEARLEGMQALEVGMQRQSRVDRRLHRVEITQRALRQTELLPEIRTLGRERDRVLELRARVRVAVLLEPGHAEVAVARGMRRIDTQQATEEVDRALEVVALQRDLARVHQRVAVRRIPGERVRPRAV